MICGVLLHLLKHSLWTSTQIVLCAHFTIVQVIVTPSPRRMSSLYLCVSVCVSATYPSGQKRYIIPAKKCLKRIINANTFWLSLIGLTHLSGMLSFTFSMLRLVQRLWLDIYAPLNSCVSMRFLTIACMLIHVSAHSLIFSFWASVTILQFYNCYCSYKIHYMVCATMSCWPCRR